MRIKEFEKEEEKRALKISNEIIEKPKISILVIIFPFLLINFIQDMRIYRFKKEFFIKEYLFLKKAIIGLIEKDIDIKIGLEKVLFRNKKNKEVYISQLNEGMEIYKYLNGEVSKKSIRLKELETLEKVIKNISDNNELKEVSLKLKLILEKE